MVGLGWEPRIRISNKFTGFGGAAGLGTWLWGHWFRRSFSWPPAVTLSWAFLGITALCSRQHYRTLPAESGHSFQYHSRLVTPDSLFCCIWAPHSHWALLIYLHIGLPLFHAGIYDLPVLFYSPSFQTSWACPWLANLTLKFGSQQKFLNISWYVVPIASLLGNIFLAPLSQKTYIMVPFVKYNN